MDRREREQRLRDLGVNPGISDRSWEDPDHEVLALLFQNQYDRLCDALRNIRRDVNDNQDKIEDCEEQVSQNRDWILEQESAMETESSLEVAWYRDWRIRLQAIVAVLAIIEVVLVAATFNLF